MIEVTERHLAEAYQSEHARLMSLAGDGEPSALWHKLVYELQAGGYEHPHVKGEARLLALKEALIIKRIGDLGIDLFAKPDKPATFDDRAKPHMDAGHDGKGWRPSALFEIGRSAWGMPFEDWALKVSRQRYRNGFIADPFTNEPKKRAA